MNPNHKGQLYGQIFVYILTIVVVGFILIYGYRTITGFKDKANQVMLLQFEKDTKIIVQSIASDFGSVVKKELNADDKTNMVCFVENYEAFDRASPRSSDAINPIVMESIRSNSEINVFLIGDGIRKSFSTGRISVDNDILCIKPQNNAVILRLEGAGDHAIVSRWI